MKNNNSKIQHDAYIKSLEKIRKSLMPLSKSFAEMAFDMSALTGVTKIISSQIEDLRKNYGVSSLSEAKLSLSMAAYNSLDLSDSYKKTLKYYNEIGRQFSTLNFKDPQTALMLSIFGGPIGVDRFYIGDYLLGVFKTITCGGVLIWAFVDQFLIRKATKDNNKEMLMSLLNL